jgi:hypothetical protein
MEGGCGEGKKKEEHCLRGEEEGRALSKWGNSSKNDDAQPCIGMKGKGHWGPKLFRRQNH